MEQTKRPLDDYNVYDYNNNKKQKVQNVPTHSLFSILTRRSRFEDLANETVYEIFEYLDVYHIYHAFFYYNRRFKNLIVNTNLPIQINVSTMSKSNLDLYHTNMILPNRHRINYLRLSNPFSVDIIFFTPRAVCDYIQLETLIFDNIDAKHLHDILKHAIRLPKLQSLVLAPVGYVVFPRFLFSAIFCLPKLKSCKLTYRSQQGYEGGSIDMTDFTLSPIEYFEINNPFSFDSLNDILRCLPKLRHLSIGCLVGGDYADLGQRPVFLKYLKTVSIKFDLIDLYLFRFLLKYFFHDIEVLHLTTQNDPTYLDAKQLEKLIVSLMPNLRVFDIHHTGSALTYHDLINQFNSPFWIDKQWFFTHQHDEKKTLDSGIFYSTNPYQRKSYTFYWELNQSVCSRVQENLNSVKHVYICSKQATNNSAIYFPNADELTIKHYFQTPYDSIPTTLNRILPLKQLTKLVIQEYNFPFKQIIKLIRFTPNLHTLKLDLLPFSITDMKLVEQSETCQYVSNTNKIKTFELREPCILQKFQMMMRLFPQVEYFKTGVMRKEIRQIIHYLFSKTNHQTRRLLLLCISQIPKVCLRELKILIKSHNLLNAYSIKYINRDLYLWW